MEDEQQIEELDIENKANNVDTIAKELEAELEEQEMEDLLIEEDLMFKEDDELQKDDVRISFTNIYIYIYNI